MDNNFFYTYYKQLGNKILVRYKKPGESVTRNYTFDAYKPNLYIESEEETEWQSIYGKPVKPVKFDNIKEAKTFANRYKDIDNYTVSGNSNYANQFIIELLQGKVVEYDESKINIGYLDIEVDADGEFPDPIDHKYPINAITLYSSLNNKFYTYVLTNEDKAVWDSSKRDAVVADLDIEFQAFDNEADLLRKICEHFREQQYDLTTGWNSEEFDMPYLVLRCYELLGEHFTKKCLSPFNMIDISERVNQYDNPVLRVDIVGMPHLDYMVTYKKHTYTPRERFKLDFIAHCELGERKVSYEESQSLYTLYRDDFQKFVDYNIHDTNLVKRINEKTGLFSLVFAMSYYTLSNYLDTLGTVKIWEQLVARFLYNDKMVPPFRNERVEEREFDGAFVKPVVPGMYKWVIAEDLNSLYPHIEMQWNIGPETYVDYHDLPQEAKDLKHKYKDCYQTKGVDDLIANKIDLSFLDDYDMNMSANFEFYRKDKMSFFSKIKRELYDQRKVFKKKMNQAKQDKVNATTPEEKKKYENLISMYNNMQMGLKILLNGGYGALGNKNFLYYKVENAEAITISGQLVNKWTASKTEDWLKGMFNTTDLLWVAGDTDSMYLTIDHFMRTVEETDIQKKVDIADRFAKEVLAPKIDDLSKQLCDYMRCYEQKMVWEREVIAEKAIWVRKKGYVMHVWDNEGVRYKEPELKITGLESVKSSTPEWSRNYLEECYQIALEEDQEKLHARVEEIYNEFMTYDVNEIAMPKKVSGVEKYQGPNWTVLPKAQPHVRGAIAHNRMIHELDLKRIPKIVDGTSIKYVKLKMPNPTHMEYVSFDTYMPEEFKLDKYVDYETIYDSSFISYLTLFLESINWKHEESITLDSFF